MRALLLGIPALGLRLTDNEEKNRPVTRVLNLLKDMRTTLDNEAKTDQEVYDQMSCWCKTNDREKTESIKHAEETIDMLTANIEEFAATASRLETEIKNLEGEVAANQTGLDKATALRKKQLAEMNAEEKDLIQSITALKSAIVVLSKHNPSMVQRKTLDSISSLVTLHQDMLQGILTASTKKTFDMFIQAPGGYQSHGGGQSGEIFGILTNMKETFENNLSASQREELENARLYEALKTAKTQEIIAGQAQIDKKTEGHANARQGLAEAKQNLKDTRMSLNADQAFLIDLKERCAQTDAEWEARQKARTEELVAISKALEILGNDDAHDNFTKTFNSFVQKKSSARERSTQSAARLVADVAKKFNNPRLAHLATMMRLDAFTKVKAAIDNMITQLQKEKEDEGKHKDWCVEALHENQLNTESVSRDIDDSTATIEGLESDIKTLTGEIDTLKSEITELHVQVKRAGENRAKENAEFQQTIADQRETQQTLRQAINVLKNVYAKKKVAFVQERALEPAGPPPPAGFETYKQSGGANSVIAMIEQIAADAKAMEAEALHDEESAQSGYESFVKESNRSVKEKETGITNKTMARSQKEGDKIAEESALKGSRKSSEQLTNEEADLHKSCDFVLKNFDVRQEARDQEVEALRQAKSILSGSNFGAFLQNYT